MNTFTIVAGLLVAVCALSDVSCMTNSQLYELVQGSEEAEIAEPEIYEPITDDADDDSVTLPGNADDELDTDYLLAKLGIYEEAMQELTGQLTDLGGASCRCRRGSCKCCYDRSIKVFSRKFGFDACVIVSVKSGNRIKMALTINGKSLLTKTISVKRRMEICRSIPKLKKSKICFEIYNVNIRARSMCARVSGRFKFIRNFNISKKIGCFKIPAMDQEDEVQLAFEQAMQSDVSMLESDE